MVLLAVVGMDCSGALSVPDRPLVEVAIVRVYCGIAGKIVRLAQVLNLL